MLKFYYLKHNGVTQRFILKERRMTDTQKLKLVQLVLWAKTDYGGSTDGEVTEADRSEVKDVIKDDLADLGAEDADTLILATLACGYNDALNADGVAGEQMAIALRKAFGIPEPEATESAVAQQS